jgi:Protein of unknown function (DUF2892)
VTASQTEHPSQAKVLVNAETGFAKQKEVSMTKNIGSIDRVLRVALGFALLAFAIFSSHAYAWVGYIGVVPLLTALMGNCPVYSVLGMSTCPIKGA